MKGQYMYLPCLGYGKLVSFEMKMSVYLQINLSVFSFGQNMTAVKCSSSAFLCKNHIDSFSDKSNPKNNF